MYASYADEYRAKGWAPFPVSPGSKIGFPAGVTGYDGTVTDEKIAEWKAHRPADNIGLRMEGVLGFDVDQYGRKTGADDYWRIVSNLDGAELPATYSMTARGQGQESRTYFFRVPQEAQFVTKVSENIEILQYHHRYAIAFPSVHPSTGEPYQWYDPQGNPCDIPNVADLAALEDVPEWNDFLIKRRNRVRYASASGYNIADIDLSEWTDGLSEGPVTDDLRSRLGEQAQGYTEGRYEATHAAVWAIGKLSVLSPELPGLRALWEEIYDARVNSPSAETPRDQREHDLIRSLKGSLAKWKAFLEENPPADPAVMAWARNHHSNKEAAPVATTTAHRAADPSTGEVHAGGAQSLLDIPLAHWLKERVTGLICYTGVHGWLFFEDGYWQQVTQERITRLVMDELSTLREIESRATNDTKRLQDLTQLARLNKTNTVRDALRALVEKDPRDFDGHPDWINTPAGVLHLPTLTVKPHDYRYYFTKITKASYIEGYTHEDFEAAKKSLPQSSLDWLQWKFGQALTGNPASDDKVVFLNGGGENGKSVLVTPIMKSLGGFATLVPDGVLLSNKSGNHDTEMATLLGARVAIMEELPEARHLDTKKLKELAGTERMRGRFLYKDSIEFDPTHSLFVTTNYVPQVYETDWAVWRRMALVKFPYRFRKPTQQLEYENDRHGDPRLRDRMKNNTSGQWDAVFTWMAVGASAWYQNGKVIPEPGGQVQIDTEKWKLDSDQLLAYFTEYLEYDPYSNIASGDLVKHFNWYLKGLAGQPVSQKTLTSRLTDHDVIKSANITQDRPRTAVHISRPSESLYSGLVLDKLPARPTVWRGLRFKSLDAGGGA